jgi:hypothetical protein
VEKLDMYREVYKALTARKAVFDYMHYPDGPEELRQRCVEDPVTRRPIPSKLKEQSMRHWGPFVQG